MAQTSFYDVFLNLLKDIYDSENQALSFFQTLVPMASHTDLKEALVDQIEDVKTQLDQLKRIFRSLNENPSGKVSKAMQGLIYEFQEEVNQDESPVVKDVVLIINLQKIYHYSIACYGSARSIARHINGTGVNKTIDFDEFGDFLQEILNEKSSADEKLTDIAEGGFFSPGINDEAEVQQAQLIQANIDDKQ